jgi:hypothetical protein
VQRLLTGLRRRLVDDQSGYVLVLAIGILLVLTITTTSIISYTSAGSRGAKLSDSGQRAYALAEAGINNALSVLAKTGTDAAAIGAQPAYPGDPYATVTTYQGGDTATWGASYASATRTWTVKSIGSAKNPTGPTAAPVTRTLFANVVVPAPPYSFVSLNTACEKHTLTIRSSGVLNVTNAMYTNSCDMSHDAFDVFGTGGSIAAPDIRVVGGWETHDGNPVIVNGVTCPLLEDNPPAIGTPPATTPAGCPLMGQPVLADPFVSVPAPALGATPACPTPTYGGSASLSPKHTVAVAMANTGTTVVASGTLINNGDVIIIESEKMLVLEGGGTTNLTVQRGYLGTNVVKHDKGKEIKRIPVTGSQGTAANPDACKIPQGTVTLVPGTYYGGVCIGVAQSKECGSNVGGTCVPNATAGTTANVTLTPGTYIMAGGGFFVCGNSSIDAPNALIYNTNDPTFPTGAGAIDSILVNTTGSVELGPQNTGSYAGLTIFQDRNLGVTPGSGCDSKGKGGDPDNFDIGFLSAASTGANGPLGSFSGTIYSPSVRSLFVTSVSGRANLAVMASCILINGGDQIFDFQMGGLFGVGVKLTSQWG